MWKQQNQNLNASRGDQNLNANRGDQNLNASRGFPDVPSPHALDTNAPHTPIQIYLCRCLEVKCLMAPIIRIITITSEFFNT